MFGMWLNFHSGQIYAIAQTQACLSRVYAKTALPHFLTRSVLHRAGLHFIQVISLCRVFVKIKANHLPFHSSWYNKHVNAKVSEIILDVITIVRMSVFTDVASYL